LDNRGSVVRLLAGDKFFRAKRPDLFCCPGVKRPAREAYHLPRSAGELRNDWSHAFISPRTFVRCTQKRIASESQCSGAG